jgi:hypothetical protein
VLFTAFSWPDVICALIAAQNLSVSTGCPPVAWLLNFSFCWPTGGI